MSVVIQTNEGRTVETELKYLEKLQLVNDLIDSEDTDNIEECDIDLPLDVEEDIIKKILLVCEYEYNNRDKNITEDDRFNWYNNYFTSNYDLLNKILETADYLGYEELVDMGCEKIADDIKSCKSVDDVKKKLGVCKEISKEQETELLNMYK